MSREELEELFPKDLFVSEDSWKSAIDYREKMGFRTCKGCEYFIDVDFSADFREYGGVCTKMHVGVEKYKFVI